MEEDRQSSEAERVGLALKIFSNTCRSSRGPHVDTVTHFFGCLPQMFSVFLTSSVFTQYSLMDAGDDTTP